MSINYCPTNEVTHNKNQFLLFKSTFATKLNHLKTLGHKLQIQEMIDFWLKDNIDDLYGLTKKGFLRSASEKQLRSINLKYKFGKLSFDEAAKMELNAHYQEVSEEIIR